MKEKQPAQDPSQPADRAQPRHDPSTPAESCATPQAAGRQTMLDQVREANEQLVGAALRAQADQDSADLRYRDLVEGLDAIVWEADADTGRFTFVSQQASTILGYPARRWLEEPDFWTSLIHPEDRGKTAESHTAALAAEQGYKLKYRAVASDGHVVWLAQKARMKRTGPQSVRVLGLTVDITEMTEREHAEEVLRENEARIRELMEGMPQVVWTNLPDGRVDFVNGRWLEYTGQTLEYVLSKAEAWMSALHPDDRDRASGLYLQGTRSGQGFTTEARFRRASDGVYRWHLNRSVPLCDVHGTLVKFLGTCTDIEDMKRVEAEREKLVSQLQDERHSLEGSQEQLQDKIQDLERFHDLTVGRELKMIEMEKDLEKLRQKVLSLTSLTNAGGNQSK